MVGEVLAFLVAVVVLAAVGVGIGILVAPRLEQSVAADDEEPGDDERTDA